MEEEGDVSEGTVAIACVAVDGAVPFPWTWLDRKLKMSRG